MSGTCRRVHNFSSPSAPDFPCTYVWEALWGRGKGRAVTQRLHLCIQEGRRGEGRGGGEREEESRPRKPFLGSDALDGIVCEKRGEGEIYELPPTAFTVPTGG